MKENSFVTFRYCALWRILEFRQQLGFDQTFKYYPDNKPAAQGSRGMPGNLCLLPQFSLNVGMQPTVSSTLHNCWLKFNLRKLGSLLAIFSDEKLWLKMFDWDQKITFTHFIK